MLIIKLYYSVHLSDNTDAGNVKILMLMKKQNQVWSVSKLRRIEAQTQADITYLIIFSQSLGDLVCEALS